MLDTNYAARLLAGVTVVHVMQRPIEYVDLWQSSGRQLETLSGDAAEHHDTRLICRRRSARRSVGLFRAGAIILSRYYIRVRGSVASAWMWQLE